MIFSWKKNGFLIGSGEEKRERKGENSKLRAPWERIGVEEEGVTVPLGAGTGAPKWRDGARLRGSPCESRGQRVLWIRVQEVMI